MTTDRIDKVLEERDSGLVIFENFWCEICNKRNGIVQCKSCGRHICPECAKTHIGLTC